MNDWFESERFWSDFEGVLFPESRWRKAAAEIDAILALTARSGGDVLDLCCGPGRHSLELARRGFRVTGVDRCRRYLDAAREREHAATPDAAARPGGDAPTGEDVTAVPPPVEWVLADMRRFRRDAKFDLALNLFTSFGYFDDPADDLLVARNLAASLRPGGHAVLDMHGKEVIARTFRPRDWTWVDEEPGAFMLEERWIDPAFTRIRSHWMLVRPGAGQGGHATIARGEFTVRLYAATELEALLLEAGFARVTAYGNLAGVPYDTAATRLVVVAER